MDMYPKYISPLGYYNNDNFIDSYGVNHKDFSTHDEALYQYERDRREQKLMDYYNNQGITSDYPQYTTDFWGNNAANNYGFGASNIEENIKNVLNPLNNALTDGTQYAQNNNIASDAVTYNPNYISDNDLYKSMWSNIKKHEDVTPHPYLDTQGIITVGGGANIDNYDDFMKVNFTVNGYPATEAQKLVAYNHLRELSQQQDIEGNYVNRNRLANTFENDTNLRITDQDAYNMAQNHMTNDLTHVRSEFTDFDYFPNPLKEVLLDIHYNTGGLNKQNWPNLYKAIANRDVNGIANNVHRKNVGWERNDWAERMARSIRF